jgi:hypothetical protein
MAVVRKALAKDFEKVYPLFQEFNNSRSTKEDWRQLFINHWDTQEDYFGFLLIDRDKVVGFLGLIFSNRLINNKIEKFCNLTTWIVKKEYRSESLLLFFPLLELKEYTITNFTPSKQVYLILKKFGFKDIETDMKLIPPIPAIGFLNRKCSIEFDKDIIRDYLSNGDLKIYYDHLKLKSIYLLIKSRDENCFIIMNKTKKKMLSFAKIHYVSNLDVFLKYISKVNVKICLCLKVCGLLIDERYVRGHEIRHLIRIKRPQPTVFKSESLKKGEIGTLYSELLVLNA